LTYNGTIFDILHNSLTSRHKSRDRDETFVALESRDVIETLKYKFFLTAIAGLDVIFYVQLFFAC